MSLFSELKRRNVLRVTAAYVAGRGLLWERVCQILGIAGAAEAAVKCIRKGLEQPSRVMPFIETRLPFYDPVRDAPVFVELVEELR